MSSRISRGNLRKKSEFNWGDVFSLVHINSKVSFDIRAAGKRAFHAAVALHFHASRFSNVHSTGSGWGHVPGLAALAHLQRQKENLVTISKCARNLDEIWFGSRERSQFR